MALRAHPSLGIVLGAAVTAAGVTSPSVSFGEPPARAPVAAATSAAPPSAPPRGAAVTVANVPLVRFDVQESMLRLERSRYKVDFFKLANQFEAQENGGFCGLASGVIVLNALRVDSTAAEKPRDTSSIPPDFAKRIPRGFDPFFARYTQGTFMDERFERVKPRAQFFGQPKAPGEKPDPGLQLRQLGQILEAHGLDVEVHSLGEDADLKAAKKTILSNLKTPDDYVIVNYFRPALGQPGGGHLSPLGAYDQKSDSFLVLDVNANAQRWVWAPASALFQAMQTTDSGEYRGFLLVREKPVQ